jgi:hypothetical protein
VDDGQVSTLAEIGDVCGGHANNVPHAGLP